MTLLIWTILGICLGVGGWQLAVWLGEIQEKRGKYKAASNYARERGKPFLVAGGPWGTRRARHLLKMPAHGNGDVCFDIDRRAVEDCPCSVVADVTHIPFADKSFGAVLVSHLLEHLPAVDDAKQALSELDRIAEAVFVAYPSRQSIAGWLTPNHHLWVWQKGKTIYLSQRGKSREKVKEEYTIVTASERASQQNNLPRLTIVKTYLAALFCWVKARLQGKQVRFTYCIKAPEHGYNWVTSSVRLKKED